MAEKSFADALNEQIANEFAASQQYVGAAVYYDAETLPRLAHFFYRQALEEREHAMMMIQLPARRRRGGPHPRHQVAADQLRRRRQPVKMALEQEKRVGDEIYALFELAREVKDYRAEQFMQWFVKEQVEEVALMNDLLNVVERSKRNLLLAEDYIAREAPGEGGGDATAPPMAGGSAGRPAAELVPPTQPSQPARLRMPVMRRNSAMSSRSAAGAGAGRNRAGSGDSATPSSPA